MNYFPIKLSQTIQIAGPEKHQPRDLTIQVDVSLSMSLSDLPAFVADIARTQIDQAVTRIMEIARKNEDDE